MKITAGSDESRKRQSRNLLFEQALAAEKAGELKKALELYKMSLQIDAQFFDAWLNAGAIYAREGKADKAIVCYQRALVSKEDNRALYNLAGEYFKSDRYEDARKMLSKAIKADPRFLQAHLLLGYVLGKIGDNQKAEISIKNALKIDSENRPALTALTLLYHHTGRDAQALRMAEILLTKNPEDPVLQKLRAALMLKKNDIRQAASSLKALVRKDKQLASFYATVRTGISDNQRKNISSVRKSITDKKTKNRKDLFDLSIIHFFEGEPEKALDILALAAGKK